MIEQLRRQPDRSGPDVIMIDVFEGDGAREEAERYRDMWGLEATILLDETAEYIRRCGIRGVPTNLFVTAEGIVQEVGATTTADLRAAADRLMSDASGGTS